MNMHIIRFTILSVLFSTALNPITPTQKIVGGGILSITSGTIAYMCHKQVLRCQQERAQLLHQQNFDKQRATHLNTLIKRYQWGKRLSILAALAGVAFGAHGGYILSQHQPIGLVNGKPWYMQNKNGKIFFFDERHEQQPGSFGGQFPAGNIDGKTMLTTWLTAEFEQLKNVPYKYPARKQELLTKMNAPNLDNISFESLTPPQQNALLSVILGIVEFEENSRVRK